MNSNLGMYIEQLVNRTTEFYLNQNFGLIEKREIPIKVLKHINETTIVGKLTSKSKVDYFGYINNHYFEMECKQTKHDYFDVSLIKNHQMKYLEYIHNLGLSSFLLIYFEQYNQVICLSYDKLMLCYKIAKKKSIPYSIIKQNGIEVEIIYPGILNLKKLF